MARSKMKNKPDPHHDEHGSLKGTLASVIILGLVIVITESAHS